MSQQTTIRKLAELVNTPVEKLLEQLAEAGMSFSGPDQVVTSIEKVKLLGFLKRAHGRAEAATETGDATKKITLSRSRKQEITVGDRRNRTTVDVVVRKKVTLVKPGAETPAQESALPVDDERADALRKLEASRNRNVEEQERLAERDRKRAEELDLARRAEEAERAKLAATAAKAGVLEADGGETVARAPRPGHGHAPPPAKRAPGREGTDDRHGQRLKPRGTHAMVAGIEDSDNDHVNRFAGQLHLTDSERERRSVGSRGRGGSKPSRRAQEQSRGGAGAHRFERPTAPVVREIAIAEAITVGDLAQKLALKGGDVVKALFKLGVMVTINQIIDHDTAVLVVEELGHKAVREEDRSAESALLAEAAQDSSGNAETRPPVVTIMGHVDHGKTSLLDRIRASRVAVGEAGGITQHIGAYHVTTPRGVVSFLDTPGHAAFSAMRARGARLTDIVVLVVAADDGVMPQTVEAVRHARAAGVPLIVAVNKMDKSDADPQRVKNDLLSHDVVAEEFGGDTQFVPVSAKTGDGIDTLLDAILLQAEVMELKAVRTGRASGIVIEAALDKGRGPVATVLVQHGTLSKGDYIVCGVQYGRVRALFDENGAQVESAGPSIPVQVLGLSGVPYAGDDFVVVKDERLAKEVAEQRETRQREQRLVKQAGNRMEDVLSQLGKGEGMLALNLLVKADVQGSAEALRDALTGLSNERIRIHVIGGGVGGITESDAQLAATSRATVIGFNVRADASARRVIENAGVDLRYFSIIYDVIDQVKQIASGVLGKEIREDIIGTAEVKQVFRHSKFGAIAGSVVVEGTIRRGKPIRVLRDDAVIFSGELDSLRRFQENVEDVRQGTECGIGVKGYDQVRPGDKIECFERVEIQRTL
jgi:translation initiation factor IF-2